MSLNVLIASALKEAKSLGPMEQAEVAAGAITTALRETPLRVEVFEEYDRTKEGVSIADIHDILDALITILERK